LNTDGDEVLVEEETDIGRDILHEQTIGAYVEGENLKRIGYVERNPESAIS